MGCITQAEDTAADFAQFVKDIITDFGDLIYPHVVDIWTNGALTGGQQTYVLSVQNQACMHTRTPIKSEESVFGRFQQDNIFTNDIFHFPPGVDIKDLYAVVFLSPGDNYRKVFIMTGNAANSEATINDPVASRQVYALIADVVPHGVTNTGRYGF